MSGLPNLILAGSETLTLSVDNREAGFEAEVEVTLFDAIGWLGAYSGTLGPQQPIEFAGRPSPIVVVARLHHVSADVPSETDAVYYFVADEHGGWSEAPDEETASRHLRDAHGALGCATMHVPLGCSDACSAFAGVALLDGCLLSQPFVLRGVLIRQIPDGDPNLGIRETLRGLLEQDGEGSDRVEHLLRSLTSQSGHAIAVVNNLVANDVDAARRAMQDVGNRVSSVVALHRKAAPRHVATVLWSRDDSGLSPVSAWLEGPGYDGNLMTGLLSGEDNRLWDRHWRGLEQDPAAELWSSLYAAALREERWWDRQVFSLFSLIESMARVLVPKSAQVLDALGNPRPLDASHDDGPSATVGEARGVVYVLCRSMALLGMPQNAYVVSGSSDLDDLWDEVGLWVRIRNLIAHEGTWLSTSHATSSPRRQRVLAELEDRAHDGDFGHGINQVRMKMQELIEDIVKLRLNGTTPEDWHQACATASAAVQ